MPVKKPQVEKLHIGPASSGGMDVIFIHTTQSTPREGPSDRHGVANYLKSKGISVNLITDPGPEPGSEQIHPSRYGRFHVKCIAAAKGIEQVGMAQWTRSQWLSPANRKMVVKTAQYAAWMLAEILGKPVNKLTLKALVLGHDQDDLVGGCSDHWDPGPGYPWGFFRQQAMDYAQEQGYRVVFRKGEKKIVKHFRASSFKRLRNLLKRKLTRGFVARVRRKTYPSDFEGWA